MGKRVVIRSNRPGKKVRIRYPSMMGSYITHTFISKAEANRYIGGLNMCQRNRVKITEVK